MYNSIQHFVEFGTKKIKNTIKEFFEKHSFGEFMFELEQHLHEIGRNVVTELFEDIDFALKADSEHKKMWAVGRKDYAELEALN